jgi:glutamate 5-kinase
MDLEDREFARGLTNYSRDEVEKIKGLKSHEITTVLGHKPYDEVVHRDNLAIVRDRHNDQ